MRHYFSERLRLFALCLTAASAYLPSNAQTPTSVSTGVTIGQQQVEVGPNSRTWTVLDPSPSANTPPKHFVEVASGMNYWNPASKSWQPSAAFFQPTPDGSALVANQVQHRVRLNDDLYVAGAVNVTLPDGLTISSSPVAIVLFDAASGQSAIVATLTNTPATQVSSNQVVYPDAFVGACADVSYSIDRGAFSQDIVFTGRFDPEAYGFPTNTTRIQILTELYSVPQPDLLVQPVYVEGNAAVRKAMASPDLMDESIGFENFVFGAGRAYAFPSPDEPEGAGAAVAKEFVRTADGRTFLVETVDYKYLAKGLLALPECRPPNGTARLYPKNERRKLYAALPAFSSIRRASIERKVPASQGPQKVASVNHAKGVIIDYIANIGGSLTGNILFAANTNYFVNGAVFCNGPTTIEAAVFKYPTNGTPYIQLNNTVTWKTSAYRPAVFTAVDDDTIGDSFASVSGANYHGFITASGYANPAIYMGQTTLTLNNCRFCYAKQAVRYVSASGSTAATLTVNHSQFVNCIRGIELDFAGSGNGTGTLAVNLNNSLMSAVQNPIMGGSPGNPVTFSMIHCTVDQGVRLVGGTWGNGASVSSINSIYANLTNTTTVASLSGNHNGFYSDAQSFGTSQSVVFSNPFQQVGAGFYYLTDASGFRNAGTSSGISASLIAALGKRTTYPPLITAQTTLNSPQTYSAQAQRDTDTLDLGFHYDPLDWELGAVLVTNAVITVNPGAAIAGFGTNGVSYGLAIGQGASLQCQGTPTTPNWIVQFNSVQEQPYTTWFRDTNGVICSEFQGSSPGSTINFRFTDFAMPSLDAPVFNAPTNSGPFYFQDCEVHGGKLLSVRPTINLTNCLLERAFTDLEPKDGLTAAFRVGLVYGGTFTFAPSNSVVQDVLFDSPTISNWNGYNGGYNAYITGLSRLSPTKTTDIILTASPSYQVGPLGNYYLSTNSTTLIDADTTTADQVGLYHYTTTTNLDGTGLEIKETNTKVDVSYHYVATDANGIPIDTNGDGIPDYLSDANGDGNVSSGEISWSTSGDLGLRVWITEPKRNANLP
jgi:hypothetical protein